MNKHIAPLLVFLLGTGCGESGTGPATDADDVTAESGDPSGEEVWDPPPAAQDWTRDILSTGLVVDLETLEATATIRLAAAESTGASFEAGGLTIHDVRGWGGPLSYLVEDGRLDVGVQAGPDDPQIVVRYGFSVQEDYQGLMECGAVFLWPFYCGNLFPCHSDPGDGLTFTLEITGVPEGEVAVYPEEIPFDVASYQIAWAVGSYNHAEIGTTGGGTQVVAWYGWGDDSAVITGTRHLVEAYDWYERTLGPYPYGERTGLVVIGWSPELVGAMEYHPYWHMTRDRLTREQTHIHEAGHAWFGSGVRIRCWEDYVLSEGTITYLTGRAIGQVMGPGAEADYWVERESNLDWCIANDDAVAWPDSCGEVDIVDLHMTSVPYYKGAFFYRAVAAEIGAETLDEVFSRFFNLHVGEAAGMQDMLDFIHAETGFDPGPLADGWLRSLGRPD